MTRIPVIQAYFHSTLFIPNVGNLGDSLPSANKTLKGLTMNYTENGLELSLVGRVNGREVPVNCIIPLANVKLVVTAETSPKGIVVVGGGNKAADASLAG